jgi:hypothetical protein
VPASAALALISQERAEQSNVALEPIFGDGRVSVEQSASDVNAATDAEVNTEMRTDLPPRVKPPTEAEATDAEVEPATEAGPPTEAEPTSAEAEPPTDADADEPAAVETSAMPVHSRAVRHQRRNLSRRQRRNLSRRRNGVRT